MDCYSFFHRKCWPLTPWNEYLPWRRLNIHISRTRRHWLEMMQWNVQREVTVCKRRPGLTRKVLSFIQCFAFQHVWYFFFLLLHQKRIKAWEIEFKKEEAWTLGSLECFPALKLRMLPCCVFKDSTSVFDVLICESVSSAGTDARKRMSSPLKCCSSFFLYCVSTERGKHVVHRLCKAWQKWHVRVNQPLVILSYSCLYLLY